MFNVKTITVFFRLFLIFTAVIMAAGCANVVSPQGGPVDEDPPKVLRSEPPNYSTNYDGRDVRIFFDEFVQLHNLRQKILVSPPVEEMPEVRVRRRSIIMSLDEELMDSTTYNFFFGDAIRDITEGNAIPNFQFVVSTGEYVDSLSVRGEVINAFDNQPAEDVYVMMYDNIYDSVVYKELPVYISRTNEEGRFQINNLREGKYMLFALKDLNFNYIFDQPDEKIAFLDSLIVPEYVPVVEEPEDEEEKIDDDEQASEPDIHEEQIPGLENGEVEQDSLVLSDDEVKDVSKEIEANFYRLYLFKEKDTVQRVSSARYSAPGKLSFAFRIPYDSVYVEEYKKPFDHEWKFSEFSKNKDTLFIWLDNVDRDSLFLKVWDGDHLIDTAKMSVKPREDARRREDPSMTLSPNHRAGRAFPYYQNFIVAANNPLKKVHYERIEIVKNDSIYINGEWETADRANRRLKLDKELEQETKYSFIIPDSTITDIFGLANQDTLEVSFTTSAYEDYGIIMLNITLPQEEENFILQLLDRQDKVLKEKFISNSGEYLFHNLSPAEYGFKVIHDKNNNGQWDPGNYLEGIQPEPVFIIDEKISVRQNWEHEVVWSVE